MDSIGDIPEIHKAETLEEVLAILPSGRVMPRNKREREPEEILLSNKASWASLPVTKLRKLTINELPSQEQLDAMKGQLGGNDILCHFVPSHDELVEINNCAIGVREGHNDIASIIFLTMNFRVRKKYDVADPYSLDELLIPRSFWEERQIWNSYISHNLREIGLRD